MRFVDEVAGSLCEDVIAAMLEHLLIGDVVHWHDCPWQGHAFLCWRCDVDRPSMFAREPSEDVAGRLRGRKCIVDASA